MEYIGPLFRVGAFTGGILGLVVFFRSMLRAAWLINRENDWISASAAEFVRLVATRLAQYKGDYYNVQKIMIWAFPCYNLCLIATWFLLVQGSFALMYFGFDPTKGILKSFVASGSALSTLGFATPPSVSGQLLSIVEGAFGLGIVVFMFTFIPGYRSAVQDREEMVGWLSARVGEHPTLFCLVNWCSKTGQLDDMSTIWANGETWFRGLLKTHALTPLLVYVPSIYRRRTWVGAAALLLDAGAFTLSSLNVKGLESARVCHSAGTAVLEAIRRALPNSLAFAAKPNERADELVKAYDDTFDRLAAAGVPMQGNRDDCRHAFLSLRARYEGNLREIATAALMPLEEPWVIPRVKPSGYQAGEGFSG